MRSRIFAVASLVCLFILNDVSAQSLGVSIEEAFPALSFERPTDLQHAGDGTNRVFVVEQRTGLIRVFDNTQSASSTETFLNIRDLVERNRSETGFLGLAFHPDYKSNGYFFVSYVTPSPTRTSVIARYKVSAADPNVADPDSVRVILELSQPESNHNGGQIAFGPDGNLYISFGDGGADDNTSQDRSNLFGSILRINVDDVTDNAPDYTIPSDNPFAGNSSGFREEIWAWGFRNPWRFSFDSQGRLWVGDVGLHDFEEVDIVEKGKNYGWPVLEGGLCRIPELGLCVDPSNLVPPILEYSRDEGSTIIGGHVYTGSRANALDGKYLYADYGSGRIWAATNTGGSWVSELVMNTDYNFSTFGVDESGELYAVSLSGTIYRFKSSTVSSESESADRPVFSVGEPYPNPTTGRMTVSVNVPESAESRVSVHDLLGRELAVVHSGLLSAGEHELMFDMPEVAGSGPLWIAVRAGESRTWRQVVLVR